MTSFPQIAPTPQRPNYKSTGPITDEGKQRSRCTRPPEGRTAETLIGTLGDAEDPFFRWEIVRICSHIHVELGEVGLTALPCQF
ncbi:MAG: hypothetical protein WBG18_20135, partial [Xanthobacteraceae bacterium]